MSKINFKHENSLISEQEVLSTAINLQDYLTSLRKLPRDNYNLFESSINLPFDTELVSKVKNLASLKKSDNLKYIFVVGIGGSNLGTMAIYQALRGQLDYLSPKNPKIIFLDTVSDQLLLSVHEIIKNLKNPDEFLINLISKSGSTTETVVNFEFINNWLAKKFSDINQRIIITTDYQSKLYNLAIEKNISTITMPDKVGGRYSVFTAVGLLPLCLAGFDIDKLLQGARDSHDACLSDDVSKNPALISAVLIYLHNKKGLNILNDFLFNPEIELVGKWYRQLMGESIGKERDLQGQVVNAGITPIVSIGSTDLHSMVQLYLGGPKDKFTNFVYTAQSKDLKIEEKVKLVGLADVVVNKSVGFVVSAILEGVKIAYIKKQLPFMEVILPDISDNSLGQYLQFKMIEMMFLAKLLNVNAFDQPSVEDYKVETKKILHG